MGSTFAEEQYEYQDR